jgi:hypothetical protein
MKSELSLIRFYIDNIGKFKIIWTLLWSPNSVYILYYMWFNPGFNKKYASKQEVHSIFLIQLS